VNFWRDNDQSTEMKGSGTSGERAATECSDAHLVALATEGVIRIRCDHWSCPKPTPVRDVTAPALGFAVDGSGFEG
jgi:hypothetical protein